MKESAHVINLERRPVAITVAKMSLKNYEKTKTAARLLGVDPDHAKVIYRAYILIL